MVLSYGVGAGTAAARVLAERHGVDPGRVFLTTGGLQGFVFYAAAQLERRRAACSSRGRRTTGR